MSEFSWTCCSWASFQESQEAECKCQAFLLGGGENVQVGLKQEKVTSFWEEKKKNKIRKKIVVSLFVARNAAFHGDCRLKKAKSV